MRKIILFCLIAAFGIFLFWRNVKSNSPILVNDTSVLVNNKEDNEQDEMDKAMQQEFELTKDPATNTVPREKLLFAEQVRRTRISKWAMSRGTSAVGGINWTERGPNNIGGRTRSLLYDLNDAGNGYKKVWAGGVGGGIWFTNDITAVTPSWTKVDDFFGNLAVTSLAQDATNPLNIYAGTGEGWFNADAIRGLGIWKSSDGGINWSQLSATNNSTFYYVQKVIAYTSGGVNYVFAATRNGGLQRSVDGGVNFTKSLGTATVPVAALDAAADIERGADGTLYCSVGIFSTDGIYRSTDNGVSWVKIYTASAEYRIELACAPSNLDKLYAMVSDNAGNPTLKKIMVSSNATAGAPTWTSVTKPVWCDQGSSNSDMTRGQAWYDMIAVVDPTNENIVYTGGVDLMKTTNGGTNWTQISQWAAGCTTLPNVHADNHALAFKPGSSSEMLAGNDGGVYRTTDGGTTFSSRNSSYNVTQYYACAVHPTNTNYFLAGAQDNGTQRFTTAGVNNTTQASGGDGAFCHIDQDDPNIQITSFTGNNYSVSTNGGTSFSSGFGFGNGSFINPTDYDDAANKLYCGNTAGTYLRWNNPAVGGSSINAVTVTNFGTITNVTVSGLTPNRVYFGLSNGSVVKVDNANTGTSKTGVVIKTGTGSVTSIGIDPANEDHMLVTYGNFGATSIYESINATQASPTWSSVEGNLPDMPVRWVMFDPRNSDWALIATDLGVWSTDDLNSAGVTDWQPTNIGLANVRTDMLQYRKGDRTIVAATHGRGLYTAVIPNISTPDINFSTALNESVEQTAGTTGCRNYKDYTVDMSIANAPAGDAIVTVNVQAGNTAIDGIDFDYTTNGDFNSITHTATFASGSTASKTVTVRIYNDDAIESTEAFTLSYSISGVTNAQAGNSFQKYTFTINSDDVAPVPSIAPATYSLGAYSLNLSNQSALRSNRQRHRVQVLYRASELTALGANRGTITSLTTRVVTKNSTQPYKGYTISIGNTATNNLFNDFENGLTQVYTGDYTPSVGDNTFAFGTGGGSASSFTWDGTSNIVVQFCFDNAPSAADASADVMEGNNPFGTGTAPDNYATIYSDVLNSGGSSGCSLQAWFISNSRVSMKFIIAVTGNPVETVLNASKTSYLSPNDDVYFYGNNGNVFARIKNLSGSNYACTQLTVDRAGTGAQPFWNNNPANYLTSKTLQVVPTTNDPSGQYQITLYFTAAEKAGWEAATGQNWNSIQIVKVKSQIKNYTPATPFPDGAGAVETVTPTFGTFGTSYTLTATFSSGFSGFAAGIIGVPLPVTLLDFTGRLDNNAASLNWSTSSEQNSKNFNVEKSTDGVNFYHIGTVNAAGNSSSRKDYGLRDDKLSPLNYYRLRMNDLDGRNKLSNIVLIKYDVKSQNVWVINNPFKDYIDLRLAKDAGQARLQLISANGAVVAESMVTNPSTLIHWQLSGNVSAGSYILRSVVDGKAFTNKLIKQ